MAATHKVVKVAGPHIIGEGPHWDPEKQVLYYTDIKGRSVHKYDPARDKVSSLIFDDEVSIIIPVKGEKDKFVITLGRKVAILTWDGESSKASKVEVVVTVDNEAGKESNRINDGKADANGRLWAGTMGPYEGGKETPERGMMFSVTKDRKTITHVTKIGIANGIAWSLDNKIMYYIDSVTRRVDAFDFNIQEGTIKNRRTAFDLTANNVNGLPDGQTVDADGNLWIAVYNGQEVIQVNPKTGKLLRQVKLPAQKITSVAFGGKNLDELYVTSATDELTEEELRAWPQSGCVFRITGLGVKGLPDHRVNLSASN